MIREHKIRLLDLFQVSFIKDYFDKNGKTEDVLASIAPAETQKTLANFVKLHYVLCKQHVYLFKLGRRFDASKMGHLPFTIEHDEVVNGDQIMVFFPITTYKVVLQDPLASEDLSFVHPVVVRIRDRNLSIHVVKLEKTVKHYYPVARKAIKIGQETNEHDIFSEFVSFFVLHFNAQPIDLNKGVKALWENGDIDTPRVTHLGSSSTETSVMNGDLLYKEEYPAKFVDIMLRPIEETVFKNKRPNDTFPDYFNTHPGAGKVGIPTFPKTTNQVINVLTAILANN